MRRVFILSSHPLFGKCIETLLCLEPDVQIVGRVKEVDAAIEQIRQLQPDVVIVDSKEPDASRGRIIMQVMREGLKSVVVGLDLQGNTALICHGEQRTIQGLEDFLGMVAPGTGAPAHPSSAAPAPAASTLDPYGRSLNYLRISVTDRCNLRCVYCRPPEGIRAKPRDAILHSEEIARMVQAAVGIGFSSIRLTGGEPLLRKGVVGLVRRLAAIPGVAEVTMTTNGTLLGAQARDLADAGLKRVNVSLDTLRAERFRGIARLGNIQSVWEGLRAAEAAGLSVKINVVVLRGVNDDEVVDFARLTLDHPWHVRFVEVMPLAGTVDRRTLLPGVDRRLVTTAEIKRRVESSQPLFPDAGPGGRGAAQCGRFQDGRGTIGFISSVSAPFCSSCNRMRLTADGYLRACLFSNEGVYCKSALDRGVGLDELQTLIRQAAQTKPAGHPAFAA